MSKRKQNFISMIETIIAKILPFGFVLWPLAMFIICTWLVISYDWPTFLTSFVCLILVIPGLIGLPKLIENLNNRLAKKNRWVFPTYGLDTFYEENPNKCVDDGICHILERENISRGYWGKYRNNAAIKDMSTQQYEEIMERLDYLEFRQDLLFENTGMSRFALEHKLTRNEYEALMDLMEEYQNKIDQKETCTNVAFEQEVYTIVPSHDGDYHMCEDMVRILYEEGRWVDVFTTLYANVSKYSAIDDKE